MRAKHPEMAPDQAKMSLKWGGLRRSRPASSKNEPLRQQRSCARWVFPQPVRSIKMLIIRLVFMRIMQNVQEKIKKLNTSIAQPAFVERRREKSVCQKWLSPSSLYRPIFLVPESLF